MSYIHKEGRSFLLTSLSILVGISGVAYWILPNPWHWLITVGAIVLFSLFLQFFRNPKRAIKEKLNQVLSPADGKVVKVDENYSEPGYPGEKCVFVSMYLSPLNVHLQRVPIGGVVHEVNYQKGKYLVAFHPKSSELNERCTTSLVTLSGQTIWVRQIAGAVARRIKPYLESGQEVKVGDELGFIRFGSRVDMFMPLGTEVKVRLGEKTTGGVTEIAILAG